MSDEKQIIQHEEQVIAWLLKDPDTEPSAILRPQIIQAIQSEIEAATTFSFANKHWTRIAAAILICLSGYILMKARVPHPDTRILAHEKSLNWLMNQQHDDGSWSPSNWGGSDQFSTGVTALSLMALLQSPASEQVTKAVEQATAHLIRTLNKADPNQTQAFSYNYSLATLSLLDAYAAQPNDETKTAIDTALTHITKQQSSSGGWGYQVSTGIEYGSPAPANSAISIWPLAVLKRAAELGWSSNDQNYARATRWLAGRFDENGTMGYRSPGDFPNGPETLLAMGLSTLPDRATIAEKSLQHLDNLDLETRDMYRLFFTAQALHRGEKTTLTKLQKRLIGMQTDDGGWKADDKWNQAGGRVYATALASLSLSLQNKS